MGTGAVELNVTWSKKVLMDKLLFLGSPGWAFLAGALRGDFES
jgi:hypothetical protein